MKLSKDGVLWSSVTERSKWSKIPSELRSSLKDWITNHPDVVNSPLYRDMLWWKKEDGTKEKIPKLLITIPIRQLHNDMIEPPENGGLEGVRNEKGEVIISDTALRDNLPFNLRPIQERHKQVCGCTLCTVMEEYHTSLRKFRLNFLDHLIGVDQA